MENKKEKYVWAALRIAVGWTFLWAFIDKLFGFGFDTVSGKTWIDGVSPTLGFLKFATHGPLAGFYSGLAGNPIVDWLFMLGIFCVGTALILGVATRFASYCGILIFILIYTAGFMPPVHNPFWDEHLMNIVILIGVIISGAGNYFGLGKWWSNTMLVKKFPIFK